jgi:hypothetical protein
MPSGRQERKEIPLQPYYLTLPLTITYFGLAASIKAFSAEISVKKLPKVTIKKTK